MSIIFPLGASVLQATSLSVDKAILSVKKVSHRAYLGISFPIVALFTFIIFLIFRPELNLGLFSGKYFWFIIFSIILTICSNLLFYKALKSDYLSELQTIDLLRNIPLIIIASIIFADERNYFIVFLALVAVCSLVWAHWEKGHFHIAKKTMPYVLWVFCVAPFSMILAKEILKVWNPISFQLVVNGSIGILFLYKFFNNAKSVSRKVIPWFLVTNFLTTVAWILYLYSYQISGIVFTILIFSIQPLLVYIISLVFFREKFNWKKFTAFGIILLTIIISQII
jgi:drug/metabolite transporter (DMT)-like permease